MLNYEKNAFFSINFENGAIKTTSQMTIVYS